MYLRYTSGAVPTREAIETVVKIAADAIHNHRLLRLKEYSNFQDSERLSILHESILFSILNKFLCRRPLQHVSF